jgi:hypothetical protein
VIVVRNWRGQESGTTPFQQCAGRLGYRNASVGEEDAHRDVAYLPIHKCKESPCETPESLRRIRVPHLACFSIVIGSPNCRDEALLQNL